MQEFNNLTSEYPYGELPLKYTKQGQQQLREEIKRKNYAISSVPNNFNQNAKMQQGQNNSNSQQNGFDITSFLPLLISMNNNGNSNQMELFAKLLPLLKNDGNLDIQAILKLFSELNKKKTSVSSSKNQNLHSDIIIDNLKKVE